MKFIRLVVPLILSMLCGVLIAGPAAAVKRKCTGPCPDTTPEVQLDARVVSYDEKDVVKVKTKVRFTTLLVLPKNEQILDFLCGDKEYWTVNGVQNFASVKPAKAGSQTNLNLITASGNIYSFELIEVSESPGTPPDLKVFIGANESMAAAASGAPRFVSAQVAEDYRRQIDMAKEVPGKPNRPRKPPLTAGSAGFCPTCAFPTVSKLARSRFS